MNSELTDFLKKKAGERFALGKSDCALWLADWVSTFKKIPDPASHLRGRYATRHGWLRLTGARDLVCVIDEIATKCGLQRTDDPLPGDIGVLDIGGIGPTGAIMGWHGWLIRVSNSGPGEPGIARPPPMYPILAAWRV